MVQYSSKIIIEFDMLFDKDIGTIRLIDEKYCDEKVFYKELTSLDDKMLSGLLKEKETSNPLEVIMINEKDTSTMDSIYRQLKEKESDAIIDNSISTAIYDLVVSFISTDGMIIPTILCRTYYERSVAKEIFSGFNIANYNIILNQTDSIDIKGYSHLMVKNLEDLLKYINIDGINVFIADIYTNYDKDNNTDNILPIKAYSEVYAPICVLKFIEMYPYDSTYFFTDDNRYFERDKVEEVEDDTRFNGKNNPFIKGMLGDMIDSITEDSIDQYNEKDDPYSIDVTLSNNEEDGIELEDGDEIIVDDSIEFAEGYEPKIYERVIPDLEQEYEDEDFDPEEVIPQLMVHNAMRNRIKDILNGSEEEND